MHRPARAELMLLRGFWLRPMVVVSHRLAGVRLPIWLHRPSTKVSFVPVARARLRMEEGAIRVPVMQGLFRL